MKREDMVTEITNIIISAKEELIEAGVTKIAISIMLKRLAREKTKSIYVQGVHKHINVLDIAHLEVKSTRALLSKETWGRYKMMGFDHLTEVVMLRDRHHELRAAWNNAPKYRKAEHEKKITKKSKPGRKSSQKLQGYEN